MTFAGLYIDSECATAIIKGDSRAPIPQSDMNAFGVMILAISRLPANEATDRYKDDNPVDVKTVFTLLQRAMNKCGVSYIAEAVNNRDKNAILSINQILFLAPLIERKLIREEHVTETDFDELESFLDVNEAIYVA